MRLVYPIDHPAETEHPLAALKRFVVLLVRSKFVDQTGERELATVTMERDILKKRRSICKREFSHT